MGNQVHAAAWTGVVSACKYYSNRRAIESVVQLFPSASSEKDRSLEKYMDFRNRCAATGLSTRTYGTRNSLCSWLKTLKGKSMHSRLIETLSRAMFSGASAGVASALVAAAGASKSGHRPYSAMNAVAHCVWPDQAPKEEAPSVQFTAVGSGIHLGSAVFGACHSKRCALRVRVRVMSLLPRLQRQSLLMSWITMSSLNASRRDTRRV